MRPLALIAADRRGATIIEFAFITPLLAATILGLCELSYQSDVQSVLTGAMQAAGRNSTVQGNESKKAGDAIDAFVVARVHEVAPQAEWTATRKSYAQFGRISPEAFDDNNKNGSYDKATECFYDVNENDKWDADPGVTGQGGASDVVVYTMTVTYDRLLPVARMVGMSPTQTITSTTILKNQPWRSQSVSTVEKVCP